MMAGGTPQGSFAQGPHRGLNTACVSCGPNAMFNSQNPIQTPIRIANGFVWKGINVGLRGN